MTDLERLAIGEALVELEQEHGPFLESQADEVRRIIAAAVAKVCRGFEDRNTHLRGLLAWADKHIERRGGVHGSDEYGLRMYAALRAALSQTDEVK